jgi:hypothetical protein
MGLSPSLMSAFVDRRLRACNKTAGDCPNLRSLRSKMAIVPFSEDLLLHALARNCCYRAFKKLLVELPVGNSRVQVRIYPIRLDNNQRRCRLAQIATAPKTSITVLAGSGTVPLNVVPLPAVWPKLARHTS